MKTIKQKVKLSKKQYKILIDYAHYSNNLYNYCLYIAKNYYKETNKYIGLSELEKEGKNNENYKLLTTHCSQQIIRLMDQNFRSFFALIRKKKNGKYDDKIKEPQYKKKGGLFNIIFTNQSCRYNYKKKILSFDKSINYNGERLIIPFTYKIDGIIKQIMFKPINNGQFFIMYINYEENKKEKIQLNKNNYLSIDLGLNNLATCVNIQSGHSFIMNGKPLKSYNRWYNKKVSNHKSIIKKTNNLNWCRYLSKINQDRQWFIDNYFNQVVSYITKYCIENDIGNIIIGYNELWKQDINLGNQTNQKFMSIPYFLLKQRLENKLNELNINYIQNEESYTSKCSFIDKESLEKHEEYMGKRIKRGLFKTENGNLINADINGAANIARKVIGDVVYNQPIVGLMFNPVKVNIL